MIWLWIAIAVVISVFLLRKKEISFENYMWILLPIDMYGINVGFIIKPYMLFSALLFARLLFTKKGKLFVGSGMITLLWLICPIVVLLNLFNSKQESSVMTAMMLMVVLTCAQIYISNASETLCEIPDVLVATSIGFGLVFIFAYVMTVTGNRLDGIFTTERMNSGIVMQFNNFLNGRLFTDIRLRGFFIDPNIVLGMFAAPIAIDIFTIFCKGVNLRNLISLPISLTCMFLTNSRTALLVTLVIVFVGAQYAINSMEGPKIRIIKVAATFLIILLLIAVIASGAASYLASNFLGGYNRAGLNDSNGRFTIWRASIKAWNENGLLTGVGFGQMKNLNGSGLECHNTWLEWMCSCGLFIGLAVVIIFFSEVLQALRKRIKEYSIDMLTYDGIMFGLIGIILALFTVDNIANSYLLFYLVSMNMIRDKMVNGALCTVE